MKIVFSLNGDIKVIFDLITDKMYDFCNTLKWFFMYSFYAKLEAHLFILINRDEKKKKTTWEFALSNQIIRKSILQRV